jgi:hypothetical protein
MHPGQGPALHKDDFKGVIQLKQVQDSETPWPGFFGSRWRSKNPGNAGPRPRPGPGCPVGRKGRGAAARHGVFAGVHLVEALQAEGVGGAQAHAVRVRPSGGKKTGRGVATSPSEGSLATSAAA